MNDFSLVNQMNCKTKFVPKMFGCLKNQAGMTLHYVLSDVRGQVFGTDPYVNH